jgi:hypothetical protein
MALAMIVALTAGTVPAAVVAGEAGGLLDELVGEVLGQQHSPLGANLAGIRADCADDDDEDCRMIWSSQRRFHLAGSAAAGYSLTRSHQG